VLSLAFSQHVRLVFGWHHLNLVIRSWHEHSTQQLLQTGFHPKQTIHCKIVVVKMKQKSKIQKQYYGSKILKNVTDTFLPTIKDCGTLVTFYFTSNW